MKKILGIAVVLTSFILISFAFAETKKLDFQPFTIECSIFAQNFPGVSDTTDGKWKKVTLTGNRASDGGHQLVDKFGDYEFWVVTGETLGNKIKRELYTYNAEIRNLKTGICAQSRSDDNVTSVNSKAIKYAAVSLVRYPKGSSMEESVVKMTCMHRVGDKAEVLKFEH